MTPNNPTPITDAELAKLDRLHEAVANGINWQEAARFNVLMVQLYPAIRARLDASEIELQGWRHERAMTLTAFAHIRDGGDPALIGHPGGSVFGDALRDMLQKRLDAAEREREELAERIADLQNERDAAVYAIELDGHATDHGRDLLAARDASMKREGAAEWLEKQAEAMEVKWWKRDTYELSWLQAEAQRLREGGE